MNKIIFGDCIEEMIKMDSCSVDLCITSPPYKNKDNYSDDLMSNSFRQIYKVLKENSLFFLNFGALAEDKFRPFSTCKMAMDCGFKLNDTITWVKNHYKPIQGSRRVNNLTEFIFVLCKGKMPKLNRLAVGIPYKDKSNAKRFANGNNLKCSGNVWYINYPTINKSDQKLHNDRFPIELPERCIKLSGLESGIVLDPYMGSASTGIAAKKLGFDFIGLEINQQIYNVANDRLNA